MATCKSRESGGAATSPSPAAPYHGLGTRFFLADIANPRDVLALFDGLDSTAWNSGANTANLALFDGVDSTAWNSGTITTVAAPFHGMEPAAPGGMHTSGVATISICHGIRHKRHVE